MAYVKTDYMDLNRINGIVQSWQEFWQWCVARDTSEEIAYTIMTRVSDRQDAQELWANPTRQEIAAVTVAAIALARLRGTDEHEDFLYWGENKTTISE